MASPIPTNHRAAIITAKTGPMTLQTRQTPTPAPTEVLIKVHAIALNPVDYYQRDHGFPPIAQYPTILGSDVAGIVVAAGPDVPPNTPKIGARVTALATGFFTGNLPQYGAFQEYVLIPAECAAVIPDTVSFEEGAVLPLALCTAWNGWYGAGLDVQTTVTEREAVLVWGGSSSVGSFAVQSAKSMGFTVFTTASPKHHEYLKKLGADKVLDYRDENVIAKIIEAVKTNDLTMNLAYGAVPNSLTPLQTILKETKGLESARIAHAPVLPDDAPKVEGIEAKFVFPPTEPEPLRKRFAQIFAGWLEGKLAAGEVVPSPRVRVVEGGLEGLNRALDVLREGVSGMKIVVSL
ncbi:zinc-binding alcohol dehydrogenase family protein [Aspergillus stella-maris]|uniref:zinc-binding alcohol dehydrogenase family protein n=1 Tax=Aspergillus stella-maris TaxID=1810926 RepID=UPI003CCC9211